MGDPILIGLSPQRSSLSVQQDAFQAFISGELRPDRVLVGAGQPLTPQVIDLFLKIDAKLKVSGRPFRTILRHYASEVG